MLYTLTWINVVPDGSPPPVTLPRLPCREPPRPSPGPPPRPGADLTRGFIRRPGPRSGQATGPSPGLCAWGQGGLTTEAELETVIPNVLLEFWGKENVSLLKLGRLTAQDGSQEGGDQQGDRVHWLESSEIPAAPTGHPGPATDPVSVFSLGIAERATLSVGLL